MNRERNNMFIDIEERTDGTYNDYGVHRTKYAPSMYIDIDNIFIRQECNEISLHKYLHDLMVSAVKEVINEHYK